MFTGGTNFYPWSMLECEMLAKTPFARTRDSGARAADKQSDGTGSSANQRKYLDKWVCPFLRGSFSDGFKVKPKGEPQF